MENDFFEYKRRDKKDFRGYRYHDGPEYFQNHRNHPVQYANSKCQYGYELFRNKRKFKLIVLFAFIVILTIIIGIILVLMPLIFQLINYVDQNGVQGIFNYIIGFTDTLWKGSGK